MRIGNKAYHKAYFTIAPGNGCIGKSTGDTAMRKVFWKGILWLIEPLLDQLDARRIRNYEEAKELSRAGKR